MSKYREYQDKVLAVIDKIRATQSSAIEHAADIIAKHIAADGIVYVLGSGH